MSVASVVAAWLVLSGASFAAEVVPDGGAMVLGARLHVGSGAAPIEFGAWRCRGPVVL